MGLVPLLRNILGYAKPAATSSNPFEYEGRPWRPKVDIYGPRGVRELIRTLMTVTHARCGEHYAVQGNATAQRRTPQPRVQATSQRLLSRGPYHLKLEGCSSS